VYKRQALNQVIAIILLLVVVVVGSIGIGVVDVNGVGIG
jgi:hypothetical protein